VRTDQVKLRQVLINLLSNAVKFTQSGGVSLLAKPVEEATAAPSKPQWQRLRFEVSDTGSGISPQDLDQLFQAFSQTQAGHDAQEGTGLGLAISHKFVDLMGGHLQVETEVGQGSTFSFTIPVQTVAIEEIPVAPSKRRILGLTPGQTRYRILVVDDKPTNRKLIVKLLTPLGFEVQEASNGEEAMQIWEKADPHLILMDMRMPVMDGYEATQRIKSTTKGQATVIIAFTASTLEEERSIILSAGCDDVLRKPFQELALFDLMHKHLGITYIFDSDPQQTQPSVDPIQDLVEFLASQPQSWLSQLHKAALDADTELCLQVINQRPEINPGLRQSLQEWIQQFRFDKITDLTEGLMP
jgi:CheY-like chemotaxis protein